jgi:hydroxymethylglutaryl-CoA lyase
VPQLADADALLPMVLRDDRACIALVANERGLERAIAAGARHLSVIAAASDGFSRANTGLSAEDGQRLAGDLVLAAKERGMWVRGYVSTCFHCPYDGPVPPAQAIEACWRLATTTVDEVVISDTLGDADPRQIAAVCRPLLADVGPGRLALHLHDTYELGVANLLIALELGMRSFDGSVGGLGGCPFAPGATGNLATERIVRLCDRLGMATGVDLERLRLARSVLTNPTG